MVVLISYMSATVAAITLQLLLNPHSHSRLAVVLVCSLSAWFVVNLLILPWYYLYIVRLTNPNCLARLLLAEYRTEVEAGRSEEAIRSRETAVELAVELMRQERHGDIVNEIVRTIGAVGRSVV